MQVLKGSGTSIIDDDSAIATFLPVGVAGCCAGAALGTTWAQVGIAGIAWCGAGSGQDDTCWIQDEAVSAGAASGATVARRTAA